MSCRESKLSSSMITFAKFHSGLTDEQILHINHRLMSLDLPHFADPTVEEWNLLIDRTLERVTLGELTIPGRSRGLLDRLRLARTETPDKHRLFAANNIVREALEMSRAHSLYLEHYAIDAGLTNLEAKERFDTYYQAALASSLRSTEGFDARWGGIPTRDNPIGNAQYSLLKDKSSLYAYEQMEAIRRTTIDETVPAVSNRHAIFSSYISEIGFNSSTQEIEVVMRANPNLIYSYPATLEEYSQFIDARVPGAWFSANLRGRDFATRALVDEGLRLPYRCDACGQFSNMTHTCPAVLRARDVLLDVNNILATTPEAIVPIPETVTPTFLFRQPISGTMDRTGSLNLTVQGRDDIMSMARLQGLRVPVSIRTESVTEEGSLESYYISGEVHIVTEGENSTFIVNPVNVEGYSGNLVCSCETFALEGTCSHTLTAAHNIGYLLNYNPESSSARRARNNAGYSNYNTQSNRANLAALARADIELAEEYEASITASQTANREWVGLSTSMVANPALFDELFNEYNEKDKEYINAFANSNSDFTQFYDHPVPYYLENAFGGKIATRESGRGFGTEIEFSFPSDFTDVKRDRAIIEIGRKLYEAGLTQGRNQQGYGASHGSYNTTHDGNWGFEGDSTTGSRPGNSHGGEPIFGGEIVSPVMYDEPETWENIDTVCTILREAGAIPSKRAGAHVHVGVGDYDHRVENHNRLISSVFNNEDLLYRLSADPSRKTHRGLSYCSPNRSAPSDAFQSIAESVNHNNGHAIALNLQGVNSRASQVDSRAKDHVEFRTFDSSLEPSVIQAQIAVAVYMTEAGLRSEGSTIDMERKPFGENARKILANEDDYTREDWNESTTDMRRFLDRFVPGNQEGDEKDNPRVRQLIALYATTRWQKTNGEAFSDARFLDLIRD